MSAEVLTLLLIVCLPLAPLCAFGVLWAGFSEPKHAGAWTLLFFVLMIVSGIYDIVVVFSAIVGWIDLADVKVEK